MERNIEKELMEMADEAYLKFQQKLLNDKRRIIGIRIPLLRQYAKKLKDENSLEYWLKRIPENYYDEVLLKGVLIGLYPQMTLQEVKQYIAYYVPKITNWSLCDTFCSGLKITKKYLEDIWRVITPYLKSSKEFEVRFALVMILNYYIQEERLEEIFRIIASVKLEDYYAKMANAWLISYCFIKYYSKTLAFYQTNNTIDEWTYNKGIQKAIESYRLTEQQKKVLRNLKK